MNKNTWHLAWAVHVLLLTCPAAAEELIHEDWESGWNDWGHDYGGASIVTEADAPSPSHALMFSFPGGMSAGVAPDIVARGFLPQDEIYGRFHVKISPDFTFNDYEQKLVFIWGDTFNFYLSLGSWGVYRLYGTWQGDGTTYRNEDSTNPPLSTGVWHKVDFHMKMNSTAGAADGIFQAWLDGSLVLDFDDVPYRSEPDGGFGSVEHTPVWGGMDGTVPQDQFIWFDDTIISTTPIDTGPVEPDEYEEIPEAPPEVGEPGEVHPEADITEPAAEEAAQESGPDVGTDAPDQADASADVDTDTGEGGGCGCRMAH